MGASLFAAVILAAKPQHQMGGPFSLISQASIRNRFFAMISKWIGPRNIRLLERARTPCSMVENRFCAHHVLFCPGEGRERQESGLQLGHTAQTPVRLYIRKKVIRIKQDGGHAGVFSR